MKLILSTHNVTLTKAIEDHIISRINKLDHFDRFAIDARVTLEHDHRKPPEKQFCCPMPLPVPEPDLFAEDSESDLKPAIAVVPKRTDNKTQKRHRTTKPRNHTKPPPPNAHP